MILVFGSTGQLARALRDHDPALHFIGRDVSDLREPESCARAIRDAWPQAVINAAAFTDVDGAEAEPQTAMRVNAEAPGAMAAACAMLGVPFVYPSTDYVFDGEGERAHSVDSPVAPLNAYGRSKAAGEAMVRDAGATHAILRTSWVFSEYGRNFLTTMLQLGENVRRIEVVSDQVGGPTPADALARACLTVTQRLIDDPDLSGTYHFAGTPDASWAEFARAIFAESGQDVEVVDVPAADYRTAAKRPSNSRLDCSGLEAFALERPDWRVAMHRIIRSLGR